jgi:hypothetical protein
MLLNKKAFVTVALEDFRERKSSGGILLEKIAEDETSLLAACFYEAERRSGMGESTTCKS